MGVSTKLATLIGIVAIGAAVAYGKVYAGIEQLGATRGSYDFVIVGGGIGGSVLANRLTENPRYNVLLIEAGADSQGVLEIEIPNYFGKIDTTYNWGHVTVPLTGLNNRTLAYTQGRGLGGSSIVNGMIYTRGASDDLNYWGKVTGNPRWSWKNLYPYFIKNEKLVPPPGGRNASGQYDPRYHGFNGPTSVSLPWGGPTNYELLCDQNANLQSEIKANRDYNSGNPLGLVYIQSTIGNGERCSAAVGYLPPAIRDRPNLTILLNTYASRVLPTTGSRQLDIRTIEISPSAGGNTTTVTAKKELILSSGAFGTPRLLLSSGIGDKKDLDVVKVKTILDLPDVGKGLSDHLTIPLTWTANDVANTVDSAAALLQWQTNRTGPLTEAVPHHFTFARIPSNSSLWKTYSDPSTGPNAAHVEFTLSSRGPTVGAFFVLLTPKSRGTVKLQSNNPLDRPLIDTGFLTHPFDLLAIKEGIRVAKRWHQGPAFKGYITGFVGPDPDILSETDFDTQVKGSIGTFWHPVGTASMSPAGSKRGVVDPDLRVKGVKGLRIVDSSTIPYVPSAHTQAGVYVLSERAADLIKDSW